MVDVRTFEISGDIDWEELRIQKEFLLNHGGEEAMGLTNFLDSIQDDAVKSGKWTNREVFNTPNDPQRIEFYQCDECNMEEPMFYDKETHSFKCAKGHIEDPEQHFRQVTIGDTLALLMKVLNSEEWYV